jgi:hypothetical protein
MHVIDTARRSTVGCPCDNNDVVCSAEFACLAATSQVRVRVRVLRLV